MPNMHRLWEDAEVGHQIHGLDLNFVGYVTILVAGKRRVARPSIDEEMLQEVRNFFTRNLPGLYVFGETGESHFKDRR
jgi:hypothetical protein